jgi:hypothetical protein
LALPKIEVTASHDTNMLPKIGFDKTEFVKFKNFSNNVKQNIDETGSKLCREGFLFLPCNN